MPKSEKEALEYERINGAKDIIYPEQNKPSSLVDVEEKRYNKNTMNKLLLKYKFVLLILIALFLVFFYLRMGCNNMVNFYPAVISKSEWGTNTTEFYYYGGEKFKAKSEGVSFCVNNRLGF
ncbi:MAG: hypothetical protein AAB628_01100 [Patescibacteria group bacterium]